VPFETLLGRLRLSVTPTTTDEVRAFVLRDLKTA
jgi:hypothetical protein